MITRFERRVELHRTFVVCDPGSNLIGFQHYVHPRMMD